MTFPFSRTCENTHFPTSIIMDMQNFNDGTLVTIGPHTAWVLHSSRGWTLRSTTLNDSCLFKNCDPEEIFLEILGEKNRGGNHFEPRVRAIWKTVHAERSKICLTAEKKDLFTVYEMLVKFHNNEFRVQSSQVCYACNGPLIRSVRVLHLCGHSIHEPCWNSWRQCPECRVIAQRQAAREQRESAIDLAMVVLNRMRTPTITALTAFCREQFNKRPTFHLSELPDGTIYQGSVTINNTIISEPLTTVFASTRAARIELAHSAVNFLRNNRSTVDSLSVLF